MYSEKIDKIYDQLAIINDELKEMCKQIIEDIFTIDPDKDKHTINVSYYTEHHIDNYNFPGVDGNGYGSALSIGDIDCYRKNDPVFNMIDEDGDGFENRNLDDFTTTELTYVAQMLNDILDVVRQKGEVNTEMDWV